jgi:histidinol-phosphate aminotransferase
MATSPRPELEKIPDCPHGVVGERELRQLGLPAVIDFSASCNPLGMSSRATDALKGLVSSKYPDSSCTALREAIAERMNVSPDNVLFGNGSIELIWLLHLAYLRPNDSVVVFGPTFGEYARAAAIHGGRVLEIRSLQRDDFLLDLEWAKVVLSEPSLRLAFLCNPNNPTGTYLDNKVIENLASSCKEGLLVVDEAYLGFVMGDDIANVTFGDGSIVRLRSMTKDYGLAGLRLGYVLAERDIIQALEKVRPPWSVNAAAQIAGLAALQDEAHLTRARELVAQSKAYLIEQLTHLGLEVMPSMANYLLVRVGDGHAFRAELLEHGCGVRDCASFGLPEYIRIGIRSLEDCQQLVSAIEKIQVKPYAS